MKPPPPSSTIEPPAPRRDRRRPPGRLSWVHPPALAGTLGLGEERLVLGRSLTPHEGAALEHPTVSRRHFSIRWDSALWAYVGEDLGSKNGAAVDGAALRSAARVLTDGAVVRLGEVLGVFETGPGLDAADPPEVSHQAIPGESVAARLLRARIRRAAPDPSPVLITGETGTGKEFAARELHRTSGRPGPFVAVNCAELSAELFESQLFGHERGAFTGAHQAQPGLFRSASQGTLLLDEVGELPLALQPKLLRALQEGEIRPVGERRTVPVDVRIVAATNRNLEALVERGGFRRDLHARLALWEIAVPALRARRADLLTWLARFDERWRERRADGAEVPPLRLSGDAAEAILLASWPDNLRGLDRLVHRLAERPGPDQPVQRAEVERLLTFAPGAPSARSFQRRPAPSLEELRQALEAHDGNIRAVAKHFGRDRRQIYRWLDSFGLR